MFRKPFVRISPIKLHSASSLQVPSKISNFCSLQPRLRLEPLNLSRAKSFHVPSISVSHCFHNGPKVVLSPLKASVVRKALTQNNSVLIKSKHAAHPTISKCNTKRCGCCKHLSCKSTIKSTVNGRVFSVKLEEDIDCKSSNIIYVLT